MATFSEKALGQARENSTSAVSVYSPAASTVGVIKQITVCNQSSSNADFSIYKDNSGTTFDESTTLYGPVQLAKGQSWERETYLVLDNSAANFAYKSSVANAITITIDGFEVT